MEYFSSKVFNIIPHLAAHWHPSAPGTVFSSLGSDLHAIRLEERLTAPESLVVGSQKTEGQNVPPESTTKATTSEGISYKEPVKSDRKLSSKITLGFPGGTVVKNPPANAGDRGLSPGPGRSHMPRSN